MENHNAIKTSDEIKKIAQIIWRSMPDSGALNQVSGKSLSKAVETDRLA